MRALQAARFPPPAPRQQVVTAANITSSALFKSQQSGKQKQRGGPIAAREPEQLDRGVDPDDAQTCSRQAPGNGSPGAPPEGQDAGARRQPVDQRRQVQLPQ